MVFSLFSLWWRRIRGLWGKLDLVLMGVAMFNKSLIQFSVDGWSCVPSLLFTWGQTMVEVRKIMATSFERSHAWIATVRAPSPVSGHHWPMPLLETPRYSQARLGQSVVGSVFLSPGSWCAQGLCPPRICFPVLCKLWQLYGGVNGDLLQEALCHTQVCCTQSPCPCGSPLLTRTSTGGTQTQFCLSLCGVSGSWCAQDSFEPSEYLWQVWGLILKAICPSYHLAGASPLFLNMGYLLTVTRAPHCRRSSTYHMRNFHISFT